MPLSGRVATERIADLCRIRSCPPSKAEVLFRLVRLLKPQRLLELGACLGVSAGYLASALVLNGSGSLVTVEGCPALAAWAARGLEGLGTVTVETGRFDERLPEILARGPLDFAFLDGHHEREATLHYFDAIAAAAADDAAIVLDDIDWSAGMRKAWLALRQHVRVSAHTEIEGLGICFTMR